ncbi:MAG: hypothetical protein ACXQTR_07290 [Candidatus Methanospirareceae archaeon]
MCPGIYQSGDRERTKRN